MRVFLLFIFASAFLGFSQPNKTLCTVEKEKKRGSITNQFLEEFPLTKIQTALEKQQNPLHKEVFSPLFQKILSEEKEGFFGYHATTMRHWVFQEIIKQALILEGKLFNCPEDFYFLRAPQKNSEDIQNIRDFLGKCREKRDFATLEQKKKFISLDFFRVIHQKEELLEDLTEEKIETLFESLIFYSDKDSKISKEEAERFLSSLVGISKVQEWLKKRFDPVLMAPYLEDLSLEEIELIANMRFPISDTVPWQRDSLVSLNLSLFSNFSIPTESTLQIFLEGKSISEDTEVFLLTELKKFLEDHGFCKDAAEEIFSRAEAIFDLNQGLLLQFFDRSNYHYLDEYSFLCMGFSSPLWQAKSSELIQNFSPMRYVEIHGEIYIHPQLRLLITEDTLNPNSWLKIKEYDLTPAEKKEEVQALIIEKLKNSLLKRKI